MRKSWAICASLFLLGVSMEAFDLAGNQERSIRNQRTRTTRIARPDCDHELADHSHDWFVGRVATSLASQGEHGGALSTVLPTGYILPAFFRGSLVYAVTPIFPQSYSGFQRAARAPPSIA